MEKASIFTFSFKIRRYFSLSLICLCEILLSSSLSKTFKMVSRVMVRAWLNNNKARIKHDSKLTHLTETSSISQNSTYNKLFDFRIINPVPTSCKKRVRTQLWVDVFCCNSTNWRLTKLSALSGDESYRLLSNF